MQRARTVPAAGSVEITSCGGATAGAAAARSRPQGACSGLARVALLPEVYEAVGQGARPWIAACRVPAPPPKSTCPLAATSAIRHHGASEHLLPRRRPGRQPPALMVPKPARALAPRPHPSAAPRCAPGRCCCIPYQTPPPIPAHSSAAIRQSSPRPQVTSQLARPGPLLHIRSRHCALPIRPLPPTNPSCWPCIILCVLARVSILLCSPARCCHQRTGSASRASRPAPASCSCVEKQKRHKR